MSSFKDEQYIDFFNSWISGIKESAGEELALDVQTAIKEEFETLGWIMEGLISRAGFEIERVEYQQGFLAEYVCKK
jgi:putative AdoMet-dependent methyltransferase